MRRATSLALLLAATACASTPIVPATASQRTVPRTAPQLGDPHLASILERTRTELALPGSAVLVIDDARVRARAAVGFRALGTHAPLTNDERFHLGSDGKAMTATLAAVLIEGGVLPPWDTPLSEVFSGETTDPGFADVTLAEIASHRAGLPRDPDVDDDERAAILAITDPIAQRNTIVRRELGRSPASRRGAFLYSNVGFVLLGAAIERSAGVPFEEAMRARLFEPLGMRTCSFEVPSGDAPYGHHGDGSIADATTAIPPAYAPAGGVHCALDDWARFVVDHIRGERGESTFLSAESYRALHTAPEGATYAFGWNITTTSRGRLLAHAGSNGFWMAVIRVELDAGRAVLFATNIGDVSLDRLEPIVHELGGIAAN